MQLEWAAKSLNQCTLLKKKEKKTLHSSTLKELKVDQELIKGLNAKVGEVPERGAWEVVPVAGLSRG